jgi:hypothetical protein
MYFLRDISSFTQLYLHFDISIQIKRHENTLKLRKEKKDFKGFFLSTFSKRSQRLEEAKQRTESTQQSSRAAR